jgi:hypothetical protein
MAIIKRRDRFVLFRLSKDEYEGLRAVCQECDAASISSFARAEILKVLDRDRPSGISQQLSSLHSSMQRITQMLEAITNSSPPRSRKRRVIHHDV